MPTQTYNTASLSFEYGSQKGFVSSNVAITTMQEIITAVKSSLGENYGRNSELPFIISISNNGFEEIKSIKVQDDLGSYCLGKGICDSSFTPLSYVGPSMLYLGGKFSSLIEPKIFQGKLEYLIQSIPPKSNAIIFYKVSTNEFSPLDSGSKIKTTATISNQNINTPITTSNFITVKNSADIKIIKNMNPNPVLAGEKITYTFSLYNYGNTEATNVVLNDTFSPAAENICVKLNSQEIKNSDFSYVGNNLTVPTVNSELSISIPAAKFVQDNITGLISIQPGTTIIIVEGQI